MLPADSDGIPIPRRVLFPPEHVRLKWQKVSRIGAGLQNMGNTCFLNATLQCLTYTPPLANFLQSGQHNHDCQQLYFCVLCKMREHVSKAFSCTERSFRPLPFIRYLKCIAKHFVYGKQEDAHEFLRLLLDAMQNRCLQGLSKLDRYSKTTTVIHQIFGGFLRSRVKCLTCKGESDTLQPMMDMILDLKNAPDVEKSLQQFVRPDILQGDNSYACERCKRKMTATKTLTVHRAPNILTLTLKRFCSSTIAKISKNIRFAEMLNLRPYMSQPRGPAILYHLYAILVHEGHSCRGGHYCSYVKASNGMWYEMNDAWVCQTQIGKVLGKQAYVLFYVRGSSIKEAAGLCGIKPAMQPSTATTHVSPFNAVASQVSKAGNVPLSNTVASSNQNKSSTLTLPAIQAVLPLETKRTSSKALPVVAHKPKGQGRVSQVLNNGSDCGHRNSCSSMKGTQLATLNNCSTLPHPKMMRSNTVLGWNVEQYRADRVAPVDCVEWHVCSHIGNPKRKDSRYLGKIDLEFLSSCRPSGDSSAIRSRHENGAFPAKREITKIIERKKTKRQNSIELCDTDKNIFNGKEEKQENCKKVEWESKERQKRNDLRKDRVLKNARRQWRKPVRILSRNLARTGKTISEEQWQVTRDARFAREASKSRKLTNDVFNDRERAYKKTTRLTGEEHEERSVPISCLADGEKEVVEVKANGEIFPINRAESIDTSESLHDPSAKEHVNIKQKKARNDTWRDNSLTDNYNGTAGCGDVSPDLLTPFGIALQKTPQFKKNRNKRKRTQHEDSDSEERSKKKKKKKSKKEVVTAEMTDSSSTIQNKQENGSCKLFRLSDHRADSETLNGTSNEEIVEDTMDVSIFGTPRRSVPSVRWDRHVNGIVSGQHGMGPKDAGATERSDRDNDVVSNLLKYKYDKAYGAEGVFISMPLMRVAELA
uniref:Ubiquitin carboxyl-terminal hydrolase n=1 Tax=Eptatretus burgeri TaxID=7764 RepID=A0A8C4QZB9_EPTBU